ncbi:MAG TPA: class I SAM-dependent methyltransferase [Candidatus Nanopelagicales bacterium]|nr:class I SAM-dependent methyltransferase [Candidatus Nanopelagicales bacterium]
MTAPPTQTQQVASLFDALADTYDDVGVDFFRPIATSLLRALPPAAGERWLDLGCGRGAVLLPAARAIGDDGNAVGTDLSPRMVEHTRAAAADSGLGNVEVILDDAQSPALAADAFDTISSCLVLFFLPDPEAALRAWLPLLAAGGRLGVTTFGPTDPRWTHVDEVFDPFLPTAMADARTTGNQGPFGSDATMEELLSRAGYVQPSTVTDDIAVRFADADRWYDFTWSVGQRRMWLAVPEGERPAVRAEAVRRLAAVADPDGSVTFSQTVRHTLARRAQTGGTRG